MSFITHCGSRRVSESVLQKMGTADGTETHRPISHWDAFNRTATGLRAAGWEITSAKHAVNSRNDFSGLWDQYFGLMELKKIHGHDGAASNLDQEAGMVAGVRNAHDKRFPYGFVFGAKVFVCDNLAFHGEVTKTRRHTKNIDEDLDGVIQRGIEMLNKGRSVIADRHRSYQQTQLLESEVNDIIVRSYRDFKAIPKTLITDVLNEFHEPSHDEHKEYDSGHAGLRSMWRLYNAYTESLKGRGSLSTLGDRTMRLHKLLDNYAGSTQVAE